MCRHMCEKPSHRVPPPGGFDFQSHLGTRHLPPEEELVQRQEGGSSHRPRGEGALLAVGYGRQVPKIPIVFTLQTYLVNFFFS